MPPVITADWLRRPATQAVFGALNSAGHVGRVVGGAVRNALIGKAVADIDIATPATPEQVIAAAAAAGLNVVPTGLKHGTVTVISEHIAHEVTTLRRDVETDGRRAVVAFTDDWSADAGRRDFTINALYCDPDGTVFDPLAGYGDLVARRVRFIGQASDRIREDYLRILRFFRFTADYGEGPVDAVGLAACGTLRHGLERLSAERIRVEVLKILSARRAGEMIDVMHAHGYWPALLGLAAAPAHVQRLIAEAPGSDALLRLFALSSSTDEHATALGQRFKLSNVEIERLRVWARLGAAVMPDTDAAVVKRWIYADGAQAVQEIVAVASARRGYAPGWRAIRQIAETWPRPAFPLRGRDLIARGLPPGARLGETLRELEAWWIAQEFLPDKGELLARLGPPAA